MSRRGTPDCSNFSCWTQVQREVTVTISVLVALGVIVILCWGFCYKNQRKRRIQAGPQDEETCRQHNKGPDTILSLHKKSRRRQKKSSKKGNWLWGLILGCFLCQQRTKRKRRHRETRRKSSKSVALSKQAPDETVHLQNLEAAVIRSRSRSRSRSGASIEPSRPRALREVTTREISRKSFSTAPTLHFIPSKPPSTPIRPLSGAKPRTSNLNDPAKVLKGEDAGMEPERYRIHIRDIDRNKEYDDRDRARHSRRHRDQEQDRTRRLVTVL